MRGADVTQAAVQNSGKERRESETERLARIKKEAAEILSLLNSGQIQEREAVRRLTALSEPRRSFWFSGLP